MKKFDEFKSELRAFIVIIESVKKNFAKQKRGDIKKIRSFRKPNFLLFFSTDGVTG